MSCINEFLCFLSTYRRIIDMLNITISLSFVLKAVFLEKSLWKVTWYIGNQGLQYFTGGCQDQIFIDLMRFIKISK